MTDKGKNSDQAEYEYEYEEETDEQKKDKQEQKKATLQKSESIPLDVSSEDEVAPPPPKASGETSQFDLDFELDVLINSQNEPQPNIKFRDSAIDLFGEVPKVEPKENVDKKEDVEAHFIKTFTDGFVEDEGEFRSYHRKENKEFMDLLQAKDESLKKTGVKLEYKLVVNDFSFDELNEYLHDEIVYDIDVYTDGFTINKGEFRSSDIIQNQSFLSYVSKEKVPKELVRVDHTTVIRVIKHDSKFKVAPKKYVGKFHSKKIFPRAVGERISFQPRSPVKPEESELEKPSPFAKRKISNLTPLEYQLPEDVTFNPYEPQCWFDPVPFSSVNDLQEFLRKLSPQNLLSLRKQLTQTNGLNVLASVAHDLSKLSVRDFDQPLQRILFVVINTYNNPSFNVGYGPISDALIAANYHLYLNFNVYFLYNPTPYLFSQWFEKLLDTAGERFTVYYTGRRSEMFDYDDQKVLYYDQVMLFDDGYILDDDLTLLLQKHPKGQNTKILIVSDIYESGTVWHFPKKKQVLEATYTSNIVSIWNSHKSENRVVPLDETHFQGLFSYYLFAFAAFNGSFVPKEAIPILESLLSPCQLDVKIASSKPELLEKNIFPEVT